MRLDYLGSGGPNYEPNSFSGPAQAPQYSERGLEVNGVTQRAGYREENDFIQAGMLYRLMTEEAKAELIDNLVDSLKHVRRDIQERQLQHFFKVDQDYGTRLATGLGLDIRAKEESARA